MISPRLAMGIPVSFELRSDQRIPKAIAQKASLLYQFDQEIALHYGLFQSMMPHFVRIYPFTSPQDFSQQICEFLEAEHTFNRH